MHVAELSERRISNLMVSGSNSGIESYVFTLSCFPSRKTLVVDFCVAVIPVELNITLWNLYSPYFCATTYLLIGILLFWAIVWKRFMNEIRTTPFLSSEMLNCPFVSYFRAYTNIFTGFSILAVDFVIYPSYFYKSRVYGTALMDSGLGFYIISNAIVCAEARGVVSRMRYICYFGWPFLEICFFIQLTMFSVSSLDYLLT